MPPLSDDDVLDFIVVEAMNIKMNRLREKAQEEQKRKRRRGSHRTLRGLKPGDPVPGVES